MDLVLWQLCEERRPGYGSDIRTSGPHATTPSNVRRKNAESSTAADSAGERFWKIYDRSGSHFRCYCDPSCDRLRTNVRAFPFPCSTATVGAAGPPDRDRPGVSWSTSFGGRVIPN